MRNILFSAATALMMATGAMAQTCTDLCDENWWQDATGAEIAAAIANADVNARGEFDRTPLHFAAESGTPEAIAALLNAGADASLTDKNGKIPYDRLADRHDDLKGSDVYWRLHDARFR